MMSLEGRASVSVALGCLAVWVLVGLGVDTLGRAVVMGLVAGVLSSLLSGTVTPGWPLFAAGCAFIVGSSRQAVLLGTAWLNSAGWMLVALVTWLGASQVVSILMRTAGPALDEEEDSLANLPGLGGVALGTALWLLALFPSAPALAIPATFLLTVVVGRRFDFSRPHWPVAGALLGLLLAYLLAVQVAPAAGLLRHHAYPVRHAPVYPFDLAYLPPANPWLLGGMLLVGSTLGYWYSRWRKAEAA
ncbi:MAG: hypothetical protein AB1758_15855 [Candidatus Eremiobacterota bacterium]